MNLKTLITSLFKIAALILVVTILLPSAIKLNHAFTHNTHQVCIDDNRQSTHFHTSDLDCDFYKFKLTNTQYLTVNTYEIESEPINFDQNLKYYESFHSHQRLVTFLRGPPLLV